MLNKINTLEERNILLKEDNKNLNKIIKDKEKDHNEDVNNLNIENESYKVKNKELSLKIRVLEREYDDLNNSLKEKDKKPLNITNNNNNHITNNVILEENIQLKEINSKLKHDYYNLDNEFTKLKLDFSNLTTNLKNKNLLNDKLDNETNLNYSKDSKFKMYKIEICLLKRVIMSLLENFIDDESLLSNIVNDINYNESDFRLYERNEFKNSYDLSSNISGTNLKNYLRLCKAITDLGRKYVEDIIYKNKDSKLNNNNSNVELENLNKIISSKEESIKNLLHKNEYLNLNLDKEILLRVNLQHQLISIRGNLKVMSRIRPNIKHNNICSTIYCNEEEFSKNNYFINEYNNKITLNDTNNKERSFELDYIFDVGQTQEDVYREISFLTESMFRGNNVCFISYGQTGSGKTYTILGGKNKYGIALNAACDIFDIINKKRKYLNNKTYKVNEHDCAKIAYPQYSLSLTIVEIYNENIYNLLSEDVEPLSIYENEVNMNIPNLKPVEVGNMLECEKLIKLSSKLRQSSWTNFNEHSSRSHCIITFYLKSVSYSSGKEVVIKSKFNLIDLAGSERISKNKEALDDKTKKEMSFIHTSLNSLNNVLNAIAVKSNHIPYRNSKLTYFLKESLNEKFIIFLLLHITPHSKDSCESISTLDFGTRIAKLCKYKLGNLSR